MKKKKKLTEEPKEEIDAMLEQFLDENKNRSQGIKKIMEDIEKRNKKNEKS